MTSIGKKKIEPEPEIRSKGDWWAVLEDNLPYLIFEIPERIGYKTGEGYQGPTPMDFISAKANNNHVGCYAYLNRLWEVAPDKAWIHTINGWGALCDLCSEMWVFDER